MNAKLLDYQVPHFTRILSALLQHNVAHDGSDTGTGKTFVASAVVKALAVETLVVAPISVLPSWQRALDAFGITGVTLTNYEKAWRRFGEVKPHGAGSYFKFSRQWPLTIFDEDHRCGGDTSINSKMMIAAKRQSCRVLSLSATIASTPIRMKAFGYLMGLHDLKAYRDWLLKCNCKPGTFGGWTWSPAKNAHIMAFLHEEIYAKGSRMRISEIPDFPKTRLEVRTFPCVDRATLRLSEELKAYYNERTIAAYQTEHELAKLTFMRQALETAKIPVICDMVEDAMESSKVAVFCNYNATIDELLRTATKRKWKVGVIRGEQSESEAGKREREATISAFQRNELDAIFCNIQAGGAGVSLHDEVTQRPRTSIVCPTFSATDLKQVLGRVHRAKGGFSRQFLIYFNDSLEGAIARVVSNKLNALDLLNDAELSGNFRMAA